MHLLASTLLIALAHAAVVQASDADIEALAQIFQREGIDPAHQYPDGRSVEDFRRFLAAGPLAQQLAALDPFAELLPETTGSGAPAVGLAIEMIETANEPILIARASGPLGGQGLVEPFRITAIDGSAFNLSGLPPAAAQIALRTRLANARERPVELRYVMPGSSRNRTVTVSARPYTTQSVEVIHSRNGAYARVLDFVSRETRRSLEQFLIDAPPGPLIIDLRFSGGGDFDAALTAADLFLPAGLVVAHTRQARGGRVRPIMTNEPNRAEGRSLVLLVGPATASSAEVFVRALSLRADTVVIGAPTFGKCWSQSVFALPSGLRAAISTMEILTPEEEACTGAPIRPDIVLQGEGYLDETAWRASIQEYEPPQRQAAYACTHDMSGDPDFQMRVVWEVSASLDIPVSEIGLASQEGSNFVCIGPYERATDARAQADGLSSSLARRFSVRTF